MQDDCAASRRLYVPLVAQCDGISHQPSDTLEGASAHRVGVFMSRSDVARDRTRLCEIKRQSL